VHLPAVLYLISARKQGIRYQSLNRNLYEKATLSKLPSLPQAAFVYAIGSQSAHPFPAARVPATLVLDGHGFFVGSRLD
jgi:hypothetical protein